MSSGIASTPCFLYVPAMVSPTAFANSGSTKAKTVGPAPLSATPSSPSTWSSRISSRPGNQLGAIRLMDTIAHRFAKQLLVAGRQRCDRERGALRVVNDVVERIRFWQNGASDSCREFERRNNDDRRKPARDLQPRDLNGSIVRGDTGDQAAVQARAQIVRMILEVEGAAEKLLLVELIPCENLVTGNAGDNGRGAAAHAPRERNLIVDPEMEHGERGARDALPYSPRPYR